MATKDTVGFAPGEKAALTKKRKLNKDRMSQVVIKGAILGDALICLHKAVTDFGLSFEEVATPGRPPIEEDKPFLWHTTATGDKIPFGSYRVEGLGQIFPRMPQSPNSPELSLSIMFEHGVKEEAWQKLIDLIYATLKGHSSLFKGHAVRIGEPTDLVVPNIIDLSKKAAIFLNADTQQEIDNSLLLPISKWKELAEVDLGGTRGILLHGRYGTGKTLIAYEAARRSIEASRSFVLCSVSMLAPAVQVARYMQPSTLFIEDLDGILEMGYGYLSHFRNILSGVESKKGHELISIFSTNLLDAVEKVDRSLLRPDRIDAIVEVKVPDATTTFNILMHCTKGWREDEERETWTPVVERMVATQCTPAIIVEIVKRAKLKAFGNGRIVKPVEMLKGVEDMLYQIRLSEPVPPAPKNVAQQLAGAMREIAYDGNL